MACIVVAPFRGAGWRVSGVGGSVISSFCIPRGLFLIPKKINDHRKRQRTSVAPSLMQSAVSAAKGESPSYAPP